jgi:hypothetical protein
VPLARKDSLQISYTQIMILKLAIINLASLRLFDPAHSLARRHQLRPPPAPFFQSPSQQRPLRRAIRTRNGTCCCEYGSIVVRVKSRLPPSSMSTPSSTSPLLASRDQSKPPDDLPPAGIIAPRDMTPPPSPPQIQDSITVLPIVPHVVKCDIDQKATVESADLWGWWQGYRTDRTILGFEQTPSKDLVPVYKRGGARRKKRESD